MLNRLAEKRIEFVVEGYLHVHYSGIGDASEPSEEDAKLQDISQS